MAKIGASYLCFAPFASEPANALPTYANGTQLAGLVSANLTANYAEAELYADDEIAEDAREFTSADLTTELASLPLEKAATLFGATLSEEDEFSENIANSAPYGGLAYYQSLKRGGVDFFRARFHPKAKATVGADNAQTKGATLAFSTETLPFKIYAPKTGDWRITAEFATRAEAIAWINEKLGITATPAAASTEPTEQTA